MRESRLNNVVWVDRDTTTVFLGVPNSLFLPTELCTSCLLCRLDLTSFPGPPSLYLAAVDKSLPFSLSPRLRDKVWAGGPGNEVRLDSYMQKELCHIMTMEATGQTQLKHNCLILNGALEQQHTHVQGLPFLF